MWIGIPFGPKNYEKMFFEKSSFFSGSPTHPLIHETQYTSWKVIFEKLAFRREITFHLG